MKLIEVANCLIEKIKKDYDGDVSLVHIYGSYFHNETHDLSDLDLYIVPKTERGWNLGETFILGGIGFDYFAISWERLEGIANHDEPLVSLITDGETLYYHSEEDIERFNKLKEKAENVVDKNKFRNNGKKSLKDAYKYYFEIANSNNITEIRNSVIGIIYALSFALAELNCTSIKRIRKHFKQEIASMKLVPDDFENLYSRLFTEKDAEKLKKVLYTLIVNTEKLFDDNNKSTFFDNFDGFYEEMIQHYNKIFHACETGDIYTPLFASVELTDDINKLFAESACSYKLPDMVEAYDPDNLNRIKEIAEEHQKQFVKILLENGIKIQSFDNIIELKEFLKEL